MNMFKPTKATSIEEYMEMLVPERRQALQALDTLIKDTVPELQPWFTYNMLGYGAFDYVNYKKENIQWPTVALASQKNYISLYVCAIGDSGIYIADEFKDKLGKVSVGKSCIRFKKLEDLNLDTVKKVLKLAAAKPGLESAAK